MEAPLGCDVEVAIVDVDAAEEVEEMDDEELFLCMLFLGMSIRLRLSVLTICPLWLPFTPFIPQVGLLCWVKVGGLATAVMREACLVSVRLGSDDKVGHKKRSLWRFTAQIDVKNPWLLLAFLKKNFFPFSTRVAVMTGRGAAYRKLNAGSPAEALSFQSNGRFARSEFEPDSINTPR